jgi:D-xylose transport system substrate-binding protein
MKRAAGTIIVAVALLVATGVSSSPSGAATPTISVSSFGLNFAAMTQLKGLAASGKGKVAVILPDTVSSARYTEFDAPYLKEAFTKAGLSSSKFTIQNAQGSDATQLTDAQSAISSGASVLVVDPLDSGVGTSIESYAKSHGVPVIDYDRLTLGGSRKYYVSFDNVKVGTLIGNGMVSCIANWKVAKPKLAVMVGSPTDNNATLFAQGYDAVLAPKFKSGAYVKEATPAGTWDPPTAETEFQQALTAHSGINAVVVPNDENAAPIITYLKTLGIPANKFPVTGQDATLVGIQNIISGYQCGTVYKPIYLEAQAAAALALYLRAGKPVPASLANGTAKDTVTGQVVKSVLLKPEYVIPTNVEQTVVKDGFVPASQICAGSYAADCTKYGIK